jgi:uncharacterized protein (TIGR02588 family)
MSTMKRSVAHGQFSHGQFSRSSQRSRISAELITIAISSLIVAILIGLILLAWVTKDDRPPILSISTPEAVRQEQGYYYVPFTVKNDGGGTAESVQVIGELRINGQVEEQGEQQIDFLSSREEEEGAFVFSRNPASGNLVLRVASYKLP